MTKTTAKIPTPTATHSHIIMSQISHQAHKKSARENIHRAVCIMMGKIIILNVHLWKLFIITIGFFITFDYCHDDRQLLNYKCTVYRSE